MSEAPDLRPELAAEARLQTPPVSASRSRFLTLRVLSVGAVLVSLAAAYAAWRWNASGLWTPVLGPVSRGQWVRIAPLGDLWTPILAVTALCCAVTTYLSTRISTFLRVLVTLFTAEVVLGGGLIVAKKLGALVVVANKLGLPTAVLDFAPTDAFVVGAGIFAIFAYGISFIPVVRTVMRISDLYFETPGKLTARIRPLPAMTIREARLARWMLMIIVGLNQLEVGITVRLSYFSNDWFNALQNKNAPAYWHQLLAVFVPWVTFLLVIVTVVYIIQQNLIIRWRRFLSARYVDRWLEGSSHYRIALTGDETDNPDQRISEDINRFLIGGIDGGDLTSSGIYFFTIKLILTISKLISFSVILWTISERFTFPGTDIVVPGFLFWAALLYTLIGTGVTHLVGRRLIPLYFDRQRYEADFRFGLARDREYSEQIALLGGEPQERRFLMRRFGSIFANIMAIIRRYKWLIGVSNFYAQISGILPFILTAPYFFLNKITLGTMMQTGGAFSSVEAGLSFFVTYYKQMAEFRAVLLRLTSFEAAIDTARALGPSSVTTAPAGTALEVRQLALALPNGRAIVPEASFRLQRGESVLFTGPSGSGKSTLFRALAGVWPFKSGEILVPPGQRVMLLPQRPYFPIGSLRAAVSYPDGPGAYDDAAVREALAAVDLARLESELDIEDNWGQRLSGGEQQRVAIARALLAKPDWLLLDESTSALQETMEAQMYRVMAQMLPDTTLVTISHRNTLRAYHERALKMQPAGEGLHRPIAVAL